MEKLKKEIANIVAKSMEQDFLDIKYSLLLESHNFYRIIKIDIINDNLMGLNKFDSYHAHKFVRSGWEGRLIIDTKTKSIISVTTISNLRQLISKIETRKYHYIDIILFNLNSKYNLYEQIQLEETLNIEDQTYKRKFKEITNNLDINLEDYTYHIVAYDFRYDKVVDMNMYLMDSNFNILKKSELMSYIEPDYIELTYPNNINTNPIETNIMPIDKKKGIDLSIKKKIKQKRGD